MTGRPIVFLDTETDGLHPHRKVWEVAMVRRDPDGTMDTLTAFVRINLSTSDQNGLAIGGFFDRHPDGRRMSGKLADGPVPVWSTHDVAKRVMEWTFGATIVGAVPSFDTDVLGRLLRSEGLVPMWHHRLRCVEAIASGFVGRELGGLADCMGVLGLDFPLGERHTALGDARAAMRIWDHVISAPAVGVATSPAEFGPKAVTT